EFGYSCYIKDEGAKKLAGMLEKNANIKRLKLCGTKIGDEGAVALAEMLKKNLNITYLNLNFNKIGDKGAKALAQVLEVNKNISIYLIGNNIGDEVAQVFRQFLPENID